MANIADIQGKWRWFIDGERIAIVENNIDSLDESMEGKYVSPQTAGSILTVHYIALATPFTTNLEDTPTDVPAQFHEAIAFKVIADLYRLPGESMNLQLSQYYDQLYAEQVREGKKYAKRNHMRSGVIKPHTY
tara:strand:+ start:11635 stop:12033 length:399 start_codon:yes stop_codon:yes gene_type:complete